MFTVEKITKELGINAESYLNAIVFTNTIPWNNSNKFLYENFIKRLQGFSIQRKAYKVVLNTDQSGYDHFKGYQNYIQILCVLNKKLLTSAEKNQLVIDMNDAKNYAILLKNS